VALYVSNMLLFLAVLFSKEQEMILRKILISITALCLLSSLKLYAEPKNEFPYMAYLSCSMRGTPFPLYACIANFELNNGNEYLFYAGADVLESKLVNEQGVLVIPLRNDFSIVAQNSSKYANMNLTIKDTKTNENVFQKTVTIYNVISVKN
jgi:hypothetical protein